MVHVCGIAAQVQVGLRPPGPGTRRKRTRKQKGRDRVGMAWDTQTYRCGSDIHGRRRRMQRDMLTDRENWLRDSPGSGDQGPADNDERGSDFHSGPVVKTLKFQFKGEGLTPLLCDMAKKTFLIKIF